MGENAARERLFVEILAANRRRIAGIARTYAQGDESDDLCQEILLQLWKSLDSFEGRCSASTWVYRIALNTAITYRRKSRRRIDASCEPLTDSGPEPIAPQRGNELLILEEFLGALGEIDRAVFLLYLEDISYRDISEITGLTENHVGVRINRLKKAFTQRYCRDENGNRKIQGSLAGPHV